ncbi:MAG: glucose-6-phosphate dehydrogenase [Nitrospinae bacterium]|jgi:glucose-6-phosphate 1-dehydrogenase|nr:glucose-6-phosphate dehydrogenase [Nitrospinota bacterium]MDA1108869.1 glucose-6-phosphate dehydrogenase [Nitrospinota bacterium]
MKKPGNCILVIFGASGDLSRRKLIPSLFDLHKLGFLPENFSVLGVGRSKLSDSKFRDLMVESVEEFSESKPVDEEKLQNFLKKFHFLSMDSSNGEDFARLKSKLETLDKRYKIGGNYIYYLAVPPSTYEPIIQNLGFQGLQKENSYPAGWKRLIIEKPFGYDLKSALHLMKTMTRIFREPQIYRIDHYLGKETVQNLLVFRFANGIFEPLWNRNYIHHVEITAAESIGVEGRGQYYDGAGALRDMVQNHLMQIMGVVAMESPSSFDSTAVRNETVKVFQSLREIPREEVSEFAVRGQYTTSVIDGEIIPGYREEEGVPDDSRIDTFAAVKVFIDNWRWGGVPFYIRAGKRLPTRVTEVAIHFKPTPHFLFAKESKESGGLNQLIMRIQPNEGIVLKFALKVPGAGFHVQNVNMDFHYSELSNTRVASAYERLLLDCMLGDSTLYARGDAVEACWRFVDPILQEWQNNPELKVHGYPAGTWGPREANALFHEHGVEWRYPCKNLVDDGLVCEF